MILGKDGNPNGTLHKEDYTPEGDLNNVGAELALVVGSAQRAEQFITDKQWQLLWREADLLFQSPRPVSSFEGTYVLEPNVQRFTVAKIVNSVVPQLYKGLFYEDPPMVLRPRPGTSEEITNAKTALFSSLLDACQFKNEVKKGFENTALFGTGIYKWGIEYVEVEKKTRKATQAVIPAGPGNVEGTAETVITNDPPDVKIETKTVPRPFFEFRDLDKVLVDPKCTGGDIRKADFAVDVRYMDYYQLNELKEGNIDEDGNPLEGWDWPEDLQELWMPPTDTSASLSAASQSLSAHGVTHHAELVTKQVSPDLLFIKKEVLEYWDKKRKIIVFDRKKVLFSGDNPFKKIPFLSSNWWNRPNAFYGMGLGLIIGQNQRVDQGTINAILKILSLGVNPIYLRSRDSNAPTQMIRTGLGKILTVDGDTSKAYRLLETPKVPAEIWAALQENQSASESASGADQMLVQGSTAGPRTSMGRTAGGAATLAGASATRLDGPLDNFIDQVFSPFLYILDDLILTYIPDMEIKDILGEELGKNYVVNMQEFHDSRMEYEVLAGASLSAKRTMAQSLTLITQIFQNPQIQQNLAEINQEYIDFKPILDMWMQSSQWANQQDIIKKMTPEMIQRREQQSQAAQSQSKAAVSAQLQDQKFQQKTQLEDLQNENRVKRDLVRMSFKHASESEAVEGTPNLDFGSQGTVE